MSTHTTANSSSSTHEPSLGSLSLQESSQQQQQHNLFANKLPHEHSLPRDDSLSFHYTTIPFLTNTGGSMRSIGEVSMTEPEYFVNNNQQQHANMSMLGHSSSIMANGNNNNSMHLPSLDAAADMKQPFDPNSSFGPAAAFHQLGQRSSNSSILFGSKGMLPPASASTNSGFFQPQLSGSSFNQSQQQQQQQPYPQSSGYLYSGQSQQSTNSAYPFGMQTMPPPPQQLPGYSYSQQLPFTQQSQQHLSFGSQSQQQQQQLPFGHQQQQLPFGSQSNASAFQPMEVASAFYGTPHHHQAPPGFGANHSLASFNFPAGMSQLSQVSHMSQISQQGGGGMYQVQAQQQQPPPPSNPGLDALFHTVNNITAVAPQQQPPLNLFGARNTKPRTSTNRSTTSSSKRNRVATASASATNSSSPSPPPQLTTSCDDEVTTGGTEEKKGQWTAEEDWELRLLVEHAATQGQNILDIPYEDIKAKIPGRTLKQVRERWRSNLDPAIIKGEWTLEEDLTILRMRDEQNLGWAVIARALRGRTEHSVKTRHRSMQRAQRRPWSEKEDKIILAGAPAHVSEVSDQTFVTISQQLKNRDAVSVKLRWMDLGKH